MQVGLHCTFTVGQMCVLINVHSELHDFKKEKSVSCVDKYCFIGKCIMFICMQYRNTYLQNKKNSIRSDSEFVQWVATVECQYW